MSRVMTRNGVGEATARIDAVPKVTGAFAYASDLWSEGMLWGATVRSTAASARIRSVDTSAAVAAPGVAAVLVAADVPAKNRFGLNFDDQPVLAEDVIRYAGEPIAVVAADTPAHARAAARAVVVDLEVRPPVLDMEAALAPDAPAVHEFGNVLRHVHLRHGEPDTAEAEVWVEGYYETAMQDQAALGPEAGLAVPAEDGGIDLYVATQWLHVDREQIAPNLGLPEEKVRIHLAGVGGAFGSREDIHMQVHACMLALRTRRPVKMSYGREESFNGHVHRHPARIWIRHGATREGKLRVVVARVVMDGGAYASSSPAVIGNAVTFASGPYEVPHVAVEGTVVYTNNPACGAMRGFGAPQMCFAHEAQMDRLAAAVGLDPLEIRRRNAAQPGSVLPTGQVLSSSTPVRELIDRLDAIPLPAAEDSDGRAAVRYPGGTGNVTRGESLRWGVGYALGYKNIGFSEGFDDSAAARLTVTAGPDGPVAEIYTAAVEMGQGLHTFLTQVVRTELGIDEVLVRPADTLVGNAGSTSASRQSMMAGGAVQLACSEVRAALEAGGELPITREVEYHHRPTQRFDEHGQGDVHVSFAYGIERAVVELDVELGLVRVVQIAAAMDVGRVLNPVGCTGQIEGGTAQGLGLALMEEIQLRDGVIANPSFTDYLIPTILDMPPVVSELIEIPEPDVPYGLKGIGESPTVVATAAVVAALRDASGRDLNRAPVGPDDLVGLRGPAATGGPPPVPDVPGQAPVPSYLAMGAGQQNLM